MAQGPQKKQFSKIFGKKVRLENKQKHPRKKKSLGGNTLGREGASYDIKQGIASGSINKSPKKTLAQTVIKDTQSKYRQSTKLGSRQSLISKIANMGGGQDPSLL